MSKLIGCLITHLHICFLQLITNLFICHTAKSGLDLTAMFLIAKLC